MKGLHNDKNTLKKNQVRRVRTGDQKEFSPPNYLNGQPGGPEGTLHLLSLCWGA